MPEKVREISDCPPRMLTSEDCEYGRLGLRTLQRRGRSGALDLKPVDCGLRGQWVYLRAMSSAHSPGGDPIGRRPMNLENPESVPKPFALARRPLSLVVDAPDPKPPLRAIFAPWRRNVRWAR